LIVLSLKSLRPVTNTVAADEAMAASTLMSYKVMDRFTDRMRDTQY
jgi:hypothetical protein